MSNNIKRIWLVGGVFLACFSAVCLSMFIASPPVDRLLATGNNSENGRPLGQWLTQRVRGPSATRVGKNHELVRRAFRDVVVEANRSTVKILVDKEQVALGTIVDSSGYIVTKASEVRGQIVCRVPGGIIRDAKVVGIDKQHDLALLKIDAQNLTAAQFSGTAALKVGSFVAVPSGFTDDPLAVGVTSGPTRRIAQDNGVLGIWIEDSELGPQVSRVIEGSGAEMAGVEVEDVVTHINETAVPTRNALVSQIKQNRPGESIRLKVIRGDQRMDLHAMLGRISEVMPDEEILQNTIGGPLSQRRTGFSAVIQHDTLLQPHQCGGPLVDLDGKVIGINIARAGRVETYALTADVVRAQVAELRKLE